MSRAWTKTASMTFAAFSCLAGFFGTRCRCAMSKSCSPSTVWQRITQRSSVGVQRYGPELEQSSR